MSWLGTGAQDAARDDALQEGSDSGDGFIVPGDGDEELACSRDGGGAEDGGCDVSGAEGGEMGGDGGCG